LGQDATPSPYSFNWSSHAVGSYTLRAVAVDNLGLRGTSAPVNITLLANVPPTVAVTNPTAGANFAVGANISIGAGASDSDGTVSKVEFFQGTTKLGEDASSPYSFTW